MLQDDNAYGQFIFFTSGLCWAQLPSTLCWKSAIFRLKLIYQVKYGRHYLHFAWQICGAVADWKLVFGPDNNMIPYEKLCLKAHSLSFDISTYFLYQNIPENCFVHTFLYKSERHGFSDVWIWLKFPWGQIVFVVIWFTALTLLRFKSCFLPRMESILLHKHQW